jgi:hypothetical protein
VAQLQAAATQRATKGSDPFALIIAVHHPPFTISSQHFPSPQMLQEIDDACKTAGIWPDLVLSGHAHLYERYTRTLATDARQIPFLVAGNGGYFNLSAVRTGQKGALPKPGVPGNDGKGNKLTLDAYNDQVYGFVRLSVNSSTISCQALGVNETSGAVSTLDQFTLDLTKHVVAAGSSAAARSARKNRSKMKDSSISRSRSGGKRK